MRTSILSSTLTVRLSPSELKDLKKASNLAERSTSDYARQAIKLAVSRQRDIKEIEKITKASDFEGIFQDDNFKILASDLLGAIREETKKQLKGKLDNVQAGKS